MQCCSGSADEPYRDGELFNHNRPFMVCRRSAGELLDQFVQHLRWNDGKSDYLARNHNGHDVREHRSDCLDDVLLHCEGDGLGRQFTGLNTGQRNNAGRAHMQCSTGGADEPYRDGELFNHNRPFMGDRHGASKLLDQFVQNLWQHDERIYALDGKSAIDSDRDELLEHWSDCIDNLLLCC
jgi:hypothetical protein